MTKELERLERLSTILKYELPIGAVIFLMYVGNFLIILITAAVILIIPFITKIFLDEKKYGWLISYYLFIVFPFLLRYIHIIDPKIMIYLNFLPLLTFIIYFFILKMVVSDWIVEKRAQVKRYYPGL